MNGLFPTIADAPASTTYLAPTEIHLLLRFTSILAEYGLLILFGYILIRWVKKRAKGVIIYLHLWRSRQGCQMVNGRRKVKEDKKGIYYLCNKNIRIRLIFNLDFQIIPYFTMFPGLNF